MDNDAKYLKRRVKAGSLDVHPTEKALVVNYELEATILGELGDPMLGDRKECQKIIRLRSLQSSTNISSLAKEIINKCTLIHPSKLSQVEQLLYYLQKRNSEDEKEVVIPTEQTNDSISNINELDSYIELLYEDLDSKIRGSKLILMLSRNPDNLEDLSRNETLFGALSRVLREEWKSRAFELNYNIIYIFFCFSTFSKFHSLISRYKVGSLVMDILEYEVGRNFDKAAEQTLRVSVYLLLNLSEDIKIEEKMKRKKIIFHLVALLEKITENEIFILVVSFLKKLSVYRENKDEMLAHNVIEKLDKILDYNKRQNDDALSQTLVKLLFNLSFDVEARARMIRIGMLPKLVHFLQFPELRTSTLSLLYHLSLDDKVKALFTYTDAIPLLMKDILLTSKEVEIELMALIINLAANQRNAELICEGEGLKVLLEKAFGDQDLLLIKMIRNISQHEGNTTKHLFLEFIGDIANAVRNSKHEDFVVECLGILGNLTIPNLDYEVLMKEYDLIKWMKSKLTSRKFKNDDLLLEIVVFIGTCCSNSSAAKTIIQSNLLSILIDLLKAKQEDDEMVLQVSYVIYRLCLHEETCQFIIRETEAVSYLIDLMHDKNVKIQRICDATLDIISEIDSGWSDRVKIEKFKFHNAQWLEIISSQKDFLENVDNIEEDEEDFNDFVVKDLNFSSDSDEYPETSIIPSSRPTSSYQRPSQY